MSVCLPWERGYTKANKRGATTLLILGSLLEQSLGLGLDLLNVTHHHESLLRLVVVLSTEDLLYSGGERQWRKLRLSVP
jgi:hypothetical protein